MSTLNFSYLNGAELEEDSLFYGTVFNVPMLLALRAGGISFNMLFFFMLTVKTEGQEKKMM